MGSLVSNAGASWIYLILERNTRSNDDIIIKDVMVWSTMCRCILHSICHYLYQIPILREKTFCWFYNCLPPPTPTIYKQSLFIPLYTMMQKGEVKLNFTYGTIPLLRTIQELTYSMSMSSSTRDSEVDVFIG